MHENDSDQQPERDVVEIADVDRAVAGPHDERGMTTAEYAVGTIAAVSFAGVLISVLTNREVLDLLLKLVLFLLELFWPGLGG